MDAKINQYLYMQIESNDEEQSKQEYKARIADIQPDTYGIEIPINVKTGRLKRLYTGDFIYAYYISEGGVKNFFNSMVVGFREDTIKQVVIQKPEPDMITKVQRRNFLRVPTDLEVAIQLADTIRFVGVTEDLSGGGMSFICESRYDIAEKDIISCWLLLNFRNNTVDHAIFQGEVIRVKKMETDHLLVMVSIKDIHNLDRQKIIKYCFERQLELRK